MKKSFHVLVVWNKQRCVVVDIKLKSFMQNDAVLLKNKQITMTIIRPRGCADLCLFCSHTIKQNRYSHDIISYTLVAFKLQSM